MQLTFLGTAAAEGFPAPFCRCPNCGRARELGGRSLRKRSSVLIDDLLLIDFGPDLVAAAQTLGLDLRDVCYGLQTHEHQDHLDPTYFHYRAPGYHFGDVPILHYFATAGTLGRIAAADPDVPPDGLLDPAVGQRLRLEAHVVAPFETFAVGPYRVTSVPAVHDPRLVALLYAIERDGRALFYGTDTAPLPDATLRALRERGYRFNVVVLDHTLGARAENSDRHMTQRQFLSQVARMRDAGLVVGDARVIAHHFTHHGNPAYPELVALAAEHGYDVAYDGLVVSV